MLRRVAFFFVSVLLVFSVTGKNGGGGVCLPVPAPAAACSCCSRCVEATCCPAPASAPERSPAAPTRTSVTDDSAWLALLPQVARTLDAPACHPLPPAVSAAPRDPAVPLFLSGGGLLR